MSKGLLSWEQAWEVEEIEKTRVNRAQKARGKEIQDQPRKTVETRPCRALPTQVWSVSRQHQHHLRAS